MARSHLGGFHLKGATVRYHTDWSGCTPFRVSVLGKDGGTLGTEELSLTIDLGFNLAWPGLRHAELAAQVLEARGSVTLAFENSANAYDAHRYLLREAAL